MKPTFDIVTELFIAGAWVDVRDRQKSAEFPAISRGRSDWSSDTEPTTVSVLLNNGDGALTPGNPASDWHPYIKRGLPVRLGIEAGTQSLLLSGLTGSMASTPDAAALDVTGDHFGALELQGPPAMGPADATVDLVSKWRTTGNQRSWAPVYNVDGRISLFWSTDGTAAGTLSAVSTAGLPLTSAGLLAFAWWLDVSNGGNHIVTFYAAATLDEILADPAGTVLGDPVTGSGTTSVFSSSAPVELGDNAETNASPLGARVRRFQFRSGDSTGTIVANPTFYTQPVGTASFADSAGRTWSLAGDAAITDKQHRFAGSVDSIALDWPLSLPRDDHDEGVARARLTQSGPLRRMQQGRKALNSTLRRLITSPSVADLVHAYWPMEDGTASTVIASPIPGVTPMRISGDYSFAADASLSSSLPLLSISSGESAYTTAPIPATIAQVPGVKWEVTRFFRIDEPETNPSNTQLMAVDTNGRVATWRIFIDDTQVTISGHDDDAVGVVLDTFATDARFFDTWAMVVLEVEDDGVNVDWTVTIIPIPLGVGFGTSGTFVGNTGVPRAIRNRMVGPPSGISTGHVIVTAGAPIGWLAGADTAWVGETAAHRFYRLCREEHICQLVIGDPKLATGIRGDPMYSTTMGPQLPLPLVDLLRECADTDTGMLFERRDCEGLAFRTGHSLHNQETSITFDAAERGLDAPFEPISDDQRLRNDVTANRPNGSSHREIDQASIDEEGLYDTSVDVNVADDTQLPDHAGWRLHLGTWPEMRHPAIATDLGETPAARIDEWLRTDLGDKVSATNLPRQVDEQVDQIIEGYTETLSLFEWEIEVNGSPAGAWDVGVRDDGDTARYDTAGAVLDADYDAGTDTSLDVETTLGPLWTTESADLPFDVNIGDIRVHVTAIGAAAGQVQTFTVDAATVNGVTKLVPAGTAVRLWKPTVRAL